MSDPRRDEQGDPAPRREEVEPAPRVGPEDAAEVSFNFGEDSGALSPADRDEPE